MSTDEKYINVRVVVIVAVLMRDESDSRKRIRNEQGTRTIVQVENHENTQSLSIIKQPIEIKYPKNKVPPKKKPCPKLPALFLFFCVAPVTGKRGDRGGEIDLSTRSNKPD